MYIMHYLLYKKYYSWVEAKKRDFSSNGSLSVLFLLVFSLLGIVVISGLGYFLRFIFPL